MFTVLKYFWHLEHLQCPKFVSKCTSFIAFVWAGCVWGVVGLHFKGCYILKILWWEASVTSLSVFVWSFFYFSSASHQFFSSLCPAFPQLPAFPQPVSANSQPLPCVCKSVEEIGGVNQCSKPVVQFSGANFKRRPEEIVERTFFIVRYKFFLSWEDKPSIFFPTGWHHGIDSLDRLTGFVLWIFAPVFSFGFISPFCLPVFCSRWHWICAPGLFHIFFAPWLLLLLGLLLRHLFQNVFHGGSIVLQYSATVLVLEVPTTQQHFWWGLSPIPYNCWIGR